MTRDELKDLVLRHMSLGFDYIDVDGWKIKPDSDDVNLLYCDGVTENIFKAYDLSILSYNKIYLIRLDFNDLPFDTYLSSKIYRELNRQIMDFFRDVHNCIILEIDNCKVLDSNINLKTLFNHIDVNILYLRDTEYINGWFLNCGYHVFLAPKLKSMYIHPNYRNQFLSQDEELIYFLPELSECTVNNTLNSEYTLITRHNNQSLSDKFNLFGYPKELFIDKITDDCLKKISDNGFMLPENITCGKIGAVHPSLLESDFVKVSLNDYNKELNRMYELCDFINDLK